MKVTSLVGRASRCEFTTSVGKLIAIGVDEMTHLGHSDTE